MKRKIIGLWVLLLGLIFGANAQKFALVDMDYVLKNIPRYEMMNQQLEEQSKKWQAEVEKIEAEAASKYKKFQSDMVFLTAEQKKKAEEDIVAVEKRAYELKRKYFGPEGELMKKRQELMKPIEDELWKVFKEVAQRNGVHMIIDRSTSKIVYADPQVDVSSIVLSQLGFGGR